MVNIYNIQVPISSIFKCIINSITYIHIVVQLSSLCISIAYSSSQTEFHEHPGLISFRMDWLDPFAVQGPLKRLLQHHSSKASILWCSVFFMDQLLCPYMTTGKTVASTIWAFVSKAMPLLFNMLSKICHCLHIPCFYLSWSDGIGCYDPNGQKTLMENFLKKTYRWPTCTGKDAQPHSSSGNAN